MVLLGSGISISNSNPRVLFIATPRAHTHDTSLLDIKYVSSPSCISRTSRCTTPYGAEITDGDAARSLVFVGAVGGRIHAYTWKIPNLRWSQATSSGTRSRHTEPVSACSPWRCWSSGPALTGSRPTRYRRRRPCTLSLSQSNPIQSHPSLISIANIVRSMIPASVIACHSKRETHHSVRYRVDVGSCFVTTHRPYTPRSVSPSQRCSTVSHSPS